MILYKCANCRLLTRKKCAKCPRCGLDKWLKFSRRSTDKK